MTDMTEPFKPVRTQIVAYTGTAGTIGNFTGAGINVVRITVTSIAHIAFGTAPTATTNDIYMPANVPEYFIVSPGSKVSAVQVAAGGNLHVTECSR